MKARLAQVVFGACCALALAASCSSSSKKQTLPAPDADAGESGDGGTVGAAQPTSGTAGVLPGPGEAGDSAVGGAAGDTTVGGAAGDSADAGGAGEPTGGASFGGAAGSASVGGTSQGGTAQGGSGGGVGACCAAANYQASSGLLPSAACPAWALTNSTPAEVPSLSANTLRLASGADAENMYYVQQGPTLSVPATYTIEARMRLVSGAASTPSRAPAAIAFSFGPTHQKNMLQIAANQVFILSAENTKADAVTFNTTSEFHVYKLVINTAQQTLQVFIDGILELTGSTFADPSAASDYVIFGEQSVYAYGLSYWDYVTHNAYTCN